MREGVDLGISGLGPAVPFARGGFAQVYRAEQLSLRRTVAVKVLFAPPADRVAFSRFERECHALGAVSSHPNIVVVHDRGITSDGRPFIIMEYREGGSLEDQLTESGPLTPERVRSIGIKISAALTVAHDAGVIHRDVKPANILLSAYDEPALADFGIARIDGGHKTTTGQISASVAHASREVLSGEEPTARSDVYSLGSTLLELATGNTPFQRPEDATVWQLINRVLTEEAPDPRTRGVPDELAAVIGRALSHDPERRQPDARALRDELTAATVPDGAVALPSSPDLGSGPAADTLLDLPGPTEAPRHPQANPAIRISPPSTAETVGPDLAAVAPDTPTEATATQLNGLVRDGAGGPGDPTAVTPQRDLPDTPAPKGRRRWPLRVLAGVLAIALIGGAVAFGPSLLSRSDPQPELDFAQALIEPLVADRTYALSMRNAPPDAEFRLLVDDDPVEDEPSRLLLYDARPGRHRLTVEVTEPDGSTTITEAIDVYVSPGPPIGGYRVNLGAVVVSPSNWPVALALFDELVAAGHDELVLSEAASGSNWQFYIDGFGADADAAWNYCDRFELTDLDECFAAAVEREDG